MKKTLQLFLFLLVSIKTFAQEPIAWYQFSDGTFINAYGSNTFTKSGNNATIQAGRDQVSFESIDLNTDILTASTPTPTNSNARNISISFWIKNNGFNSNTYKVLLNSLNTLTHPAFFNNTSTGIANQNTGFMIRAIASGVQVKALYKDTNNNAIFANTFTATALNDGNWHHVAIRFVVEKKSINNSASKRVNLLVILDVDANSSFNRSNELTLPETVANDVNPFYKQGDFSIGGIPNFNISDKYNGQIDDLVIYDRNLSNAEISELNKPKKDLFISNIKNGNITFFPNTNTSKYINGLKVELTAQPYSNYGFTNWSGDVDAASVNTNPLSIIMNAEKNITANFSNTASVKDINKIDFSFYPNPAENYIYLSINDVLKEGKIYNLLGNKVMKFNSKEVNISKLSAGTYFIKVSTDSGKTGIRKLIKN